MQKFLKRDITFIGLLCIIITAIFWQFFIKQYILFPGGYMLAWYEPWKTDHIVNGVIQIVHKPVISDVFRQTYPFKTLAVDIIKKGQLPLWNPYNGAGMPLLATSNIGLLDPFNIVFFIFSYPIAWNIYLILQYFLIGYFSYMFFRKLHISQFASFFATITFLFSGVVTVRIPYGIFGIGFAMLPASLYLIEDYLQNKSKKIFILPIVIAILILSVLPQTTLYILFFVFGYVLYRTYLGGKSEQKNHLLILFLLTILGFGIAAIQIIPTAELYKYANMTQQSSSFIFDRFLLAPTYLVSLFIPNYFGSIATYNYWGSGDYIESTTYLGIIPLLFVCIAIFQKASAKIPNIKNYLFFIIGTSLILCINWPGAKLFYSIPIPILSTGIPTRIFLLSTFSICILAGIGFDNYFANIKKNNYERFIFLFYFLFSMTLLGVTFLLYKTHFPCENPVIKNCGQIATRNTSIEICVFLIASLFLLLWMYKKTKKIIIEIFICFLIICIGLFNTNKFFPFSPQKDVMPPNNLITFLTAHAQNGRTFGLGKANIATDFATYYRFYDPNYYHPLYIKRYGELVAYANSGAMNSPLLRSDVEITNEAQENSSRRQRLFNILGIKYLIFDKTDAIQNPIWENNNWAVENNSTALSRLYIVDEYELATNNDILKKLFDTKFDPKTSVILEKKPKQFLNSDEKLNSSIIDAKFSENKISANVQTNKNSLLVLSDNYYPGWNAYVDGKKTQILRANYTFRAIVLSQGKHSITFVYEPISVTIGVIISCVSLLIFLSLLWMTSVAKNRQQ